MLASVSEQALKSVKLALQKFQIDMERSSGIIMNQSDVRLSSALATLMSVKHEMEDAEGVVRKLEGDLIFAEDKIREYERKRNDARYRAQQFQNHASSMESQKAGLENQLRACQNSQDPKAESESAALQSQISALNSQINNLQSQASAEQQRMYMFENELQNYTVRRNKCRKELEAARERLNKFRNKVSRMETAYSQMKIDMQEYTDAAKHFEREANRMALHNMGAVGKCIAIVEKYMNQRL